MPWNIGHLIDRGRLMVQLEDHLRDEASRAESRDRLEKLIATPDGAAETLLEWSAWAPGPSGGQLWPNESPEMIHLRDDILELGMIDQADSNRRAHLIARGLVETMDRLTAAPGRDVMITMLCVLFASEWEVYITHSPRTVLTTFAMPAEAPASMAPPERSDPAAERRMQHGMVVLNFDGEHGRPHP